MGLSGIKFARKKTESVKVKSLPFMKAWSKEIFQKLQTM